MQFQPFFIAALFAAGALAACGNEDQTKPAGAEPERGKPASGTDPAGAARTTPQPENVSINDSTAGGRPTAFSQCAVCHGVEPDARPMIGPTLAGVYGATAGTRENFAYSAGMRESGIVWTDETLDAFLENPQKVVRGNRMAYAGERNAERRAAIIAYLKTLPAD